MGGLTSPKGGDTKTTTQVNQVPAYVQAAQGNLLNAANGILSPYLQQQGFTTAPLNSDQTAAYDLTRQLAMGVFTKPSNANYGYGSGGSTSTAPAVNAHDGEPAMPNGPQGGSPVPVASTGLQSVGGAPASPVLSQVSGQGYTMTPTQAQGYSASTYTPSTSNAATYDPTSYSASKADVAQVTGDSIRALLSPYTRDVVDTTNATINRNANQQMAQLSARNAAAGSFGGSRQAIQSAQLARSTGEQIASTTAQLMAQGWDKASALALANAQMANAGNQFNASADNAASQFNANSANTAGQFNANSRNAADQFNASANNAAGQYNASANNAAGQFGASASNAAQAANAASTNAANQFNAQLAYNAANQNNANLLQQYGMDINKWQTGQQLGISQQQLGLSQQQIQEALRSNDFNRQMQAIQALLGVGNAQQQYYQGALSQPLQYLQLLGQLTPQQYGSTTIGTQPNTAQSPLQTLLGLGTSLAGLALK